MSYQAIVNAIATTWKYDPHMPVYVEGPPGCGKTSMAFDLADKLGLDARPHHKGGEVVIFRPSLRDPVDLMGTPNPVDGLTRWLPPAELAFLREGRGLLVIDEMPQAGQQMQNALAGLALDRFIGELALSDEVYVMATGNRTIDKAGANRVVSQLGNRVARFELESPHIDEWVQWALKAGLDPLYIAFLRWKPSLLLDFDPDRFSNPTPRSHERAGRVGMVPQEDGELAPEDVPDDVRLQITQGIVGEGCAVEYMGFRRHVNTLPDMDRIMKDPAGTPIPDENEVRYVCVHTLATRTESAEIFDQLMTYISRMPADFQVLYVKSCIKTCPQVMQTKTFVQWAGDNHALFH